MFINLEDFRMVIDGAALKTVAQASPENIESAVTVAVEEVSGYLRPVYDTVEIFSRTGDARNRLIVAYTADIALYHLAASLPQKMGVEIRRERYDRAMRWLEGVQSGRIIPDLPGVTAAGGAEGFGTSFRSSPRLRHDW